MHTHTHIYIYIHTHIYIYKMYIYIYTYYICIILYIYIILHGTHINFSPIHFSSYGNLKAIFETTFRHFSVTSAFNGYCYKQLLIAKTLSFY